ncbi:UNVERIFIED_CONTAM: hypothetical protein Slati_1355800 [Sesamum latifolium]|uniref:Uncharacterized protein n=1 Tax=Sesamum latifolium TaxID=2727402 RepID=A0AAW2XHV9_9LAMI
MKCILISLPSRSAIALLESPARMLALVSFGDGCCYLQGCNPLVYQLLGISENVQIEYSAIWVGAGAWSLPKVYVLALSLVSPWIFFESGCHKRWSGVSVKILLSLDDPVEDHWNLYFPPAMVVLE